MPSILVLNSSVSSQSVSRELVDKAVALLAAACPGASFVTHDLGAEPLPHLSTLNLAGIRFAPQTMFEIETRKRSDALLAELRQADLIVVGAPMYNFSLSSGLHAWFDHVIRPDETFRYDESGPVGLMTGKRAIVVESRGDLHSEDSGTVVDFQEPYLRQLFGFMGIVDVDFVHAEKIGYGPETRAAAIAGAETVLARIIGDGTPLAA